MDQRSVSVLSWEPNESPVSVVELILGRRQFDDVAIHRAIGRRLAETGNEQPVDGVIRSASAGEAWAVELIETIDVPAPTNRLSMPVQDINSGIARGRISDLFDRWVPRRRRHA